MLLALVLFSAIAQDTITVNYTDHAELLSPVGYEVLTANKIEANYGFLQVFGLFDDIGNVLQLYKSDPQYQLSINQHTALEDFPEVSDKLELLKEEHSEYSRTVTPMYKQFEKTRKEYNGSSSPYPCVDTFIQQLFSKLQTVGKKELTTAVQDAVKSKSTEGGK